MILIDPNGQAWQPTFNQKTRQQTGYTWIDPSQSYDKNGNLLAGLYEIAIFFSNEGYNGKTFDANSKWNMGSSIATVYCADGTTREFEACTYPSDLTKYATVPEGMYEAMLGKHRDKYTALRISDIGTTNFSDSSIELGQPNPSNPETTIAKGINAHKPGFGNLTGMTSDSRPVSAGCFLIDINRWSEFIGLFSANTRIGITVSRSLAAPTNQNVSLRLKTTSLHLTNPIDNLRVATLPIFKTN